MCVKLLSRSGPALLVGLIGNQSCVCHQGGGRGGGQRQSPCPINSQIKVGHPQCPDITRTDKLAAQSYAAQHSLMKSLKNY